MKADLIYKNRGVTKMKVGFTGTRNGMTVAQGKELLAILTEYKPIEFHHGDCIGADSEAHEIASRLGIKVVIHPPKDDLYRAFKPSEFIRTPKAYLERNHNIVDATDLLVAAPKTVKEELRSGTWATIRYARREGKTINLLLP